VRNPREHGRPATGGDSADAQVRTPDPAGPGNAELARVFRSAGPHRGTAGDVRPAAAGGDGSGPLDPQVGAAIGQARGGGSPLPAAVRGELEQSFDADLSAVRTHTGDRADQLSTAVNAQAFTVGSDIFFSRGSYDPSPGAGRELLAHEVTHVVQQKSGAAGGPSQVSHPDDPAEVQARQVGRLLMSGAGAPAGATAASQLPQAAGNRALARVLAPAVVQRNTGTQTDVQKLDEMLDRVDVPESEVIALIAAMAPGDKSVVATPAYSKKIAAALDFAEMRQVVAVLPLNLGQKLEWLDAAAMTTRGIGYDEIRSLVTGAGQGDRDALKAGWMGFFVAVCDNATMVTALNDLNYDLTTKLTWLNAEMIATSVELDYATIRPWITAAGQGDRNLLKTAGWMGFFVAVCDNATMETAVGDLGFDLVTKLTWMMAEGGSYPAFKNVITAAPDKPVALADQALLLRLHDHFGWDDFAKCVELLGRTIPGPGALIGDATVQAALASAFTASNPAITPAPPAPGPPGVHEEGGFIYLNIITNAITTDRVAPGGQASLPLNNPNPPAHAITVGGYHTHPNVGPVWGAPFPSGADTAWATRNGIPLLIRGAFPAVANVSDTSTGAARAHLAGDRGFPGPTGGIAPQATLDGELDDL
jgi:hypothetical protein